MKTCSTRCEAIVEHLSDAQACAALIVRFEILMLSELGFGLDLQSCAATGADTRTDLCVAEIGPCGFARGRRAVA